MTGRRDKADGNRRSVRAMVRWVGGRFDALIRAGEIGTALRFPRQR
jgi:hypothetical protein